MNPTQERNVGKLVKLLADANSVIHDLHSSGISAEIDCVQMRNGCEVLVVKNVSLKPKESEC